jgi:hypothetical protein
MSDIHLRLINAVTGSDTNTIRELMSPSILCCNEGEGPDACISYFLPENSERGKSYQSKLANVINGGYSIITIQGDTLARYPKIFPPQIGENGYSSGSEDYVSGFYEYVTEKAIVVYDSADVTSESKDLAGSRYVKRLNRINCKDYEKVWDIDCEWQKIKTAENDSGWVKNESLLNPYHFRIEFSKVNIAWKMSLVTTMSCLPREDSIQMEAIPGGEEIEE